MSSDKLKRLPPDNKDRELELASAAVQISHKLTALQFHTWAEMLHNAFDSLSTEDKYVISVRDLKRRIGYKSRNDEHFKEMLEGIVGTRVKWNLLKKDKTTTWGVSSMLATVEISNSSCSYSYGQILKEKLHHPEIYAKLSLALMKKFKKKYALALWSVCEDYWKVGQTPWIKLPTLRELLGAKDQKYTKEFKTFNRDVLKPAVKDVNEISNLLVEPVFKREKRRVVAVKFKIRRKPEKQLPKPKSDTQETLTELAEELHKRKVSRKAAIELADKYPAERVEKAINLYDAGEIKTPGGIRRFLEDWWELSDEQERQVEDLEHYQEQETLEKQAEAIQMQRISKALTNFPARDEWVSEHLAERKRIRELMGRTITQAELDEYQKDLEQRYPETNEARLEYINQHLDKFNAESKDIVKELEQQK